MSFLNFRILSKGTCLLPELPRGGCFNRAIKDPRKAAHTHTQASYATSAIQRSFGTRAPWLKPLSTDSATFSTNITPSKSNLFDESIKVNAPIEISSRNLAPSLRPCPVDDITLYNRSAWARKDALDHLKRAWPNVQIHEIGLAGQKQAPGSHSFTGLTPKQIDDLDAIKAVIDRVKGSTDNAPAFYLGWQPKAEDAGFITNIKKMGAIPVAANPEALLKLAKKQEFKATCDELGITTSNWGRLKGKTLEEATDLLYNLTRNSKLWVKSDFGGGGRGTKCLGEQHSKQDIEKVIKEMIGFSQNDIGNIYYEEGVVANADERLMQLEVEVLGDRHGNITVDPNSRFVMVNDKNQKFSEWGFVNGEDCGVNNDALRDCQEQAKKIAEAVGYDGKGTVEFLLKVKPDGTVSSYALELNGRVQCEWKALGKLGNQGHEGVNTHALQLLAACSEPVPEQSSYTPTAVAVCHDRIIVANPGPTWDYPAKGQFNGVSYDDQPGIEVNFCRVPISPEADYQMGNVLFTVTEGELAATGETPIALLAKKRQLFWNSVVYKGSEEVANCGYPGFMRKHAASLQGPADFDLFESNRVTLQQPPVELTASAQARKLVADPSFIDFVNGEHGSPTVIAGNPKPTPKRLAEIQAEIDRVRQLLPKPPTLWSKYCKENATSGNDSISAYNDYLIEQAELIEKHGAALFIVDPRDFTQAGAGSMAWLVTDTSREGYEKLLPGGVDTPIFGVEWGGAQPAGAARHGVSPHYVHRNYESGQFQVISLNRSQWGQGLGRKTPKQQAFINKMHGKSRFGLNNFMAGNTKSTTPLEASMKKYNRVTSNYVFDPSFPMDDFENWIEEKVDAHIEDCLAAGIPREKIQFCFRVKNPGEKAEWSTTVIHEHAAVATRVCLAKGIRKPIMNAHNHNLSGVTSAIAAAAIQENREKGMPVYLAIDVAHQGNNTHNDILTVAAAMDLSTKTRKELKEWSTYQATVSGILSEWDSRDLSRQHTSPGSVKAGGTTSSDMEDFIANGLDVGLIDHAYNLGYGITGLAGIVTPYSEANKQIGKAALLSEPFKQFLLEKHGISDISESNHDHLNAFILGGGSLELPANVLDILDTWITDPEAIMRSRKAPKVVERLMENIGYEAPDSSAEDDFDPLETQQMLQEQFPETRVTEWDVYNYVQFGPQLAESLLKARENGTDPSALYVKNPVQYVGGAKAGDTLMFRNVPIEIISVQDLGQGGVVVEASVAGESITTVRQPKLQGVGVEASTQFASDARHGIGPSQSGVLYKLLVTSGAKVQKEDAVAVSIALKQESELRAPYSGVVGQILAKEGDPLQRNQLLMTIVPDDKSNST